MKSHRNLLIVEDELVIAESTKSLILDLFKDIVIRVAGDSNEALSCIGEETPDLVFLDIRLGKHDSGIELSKKLEQQQIPFIFLTAHGDEQTVSQAIQSQPLGYLVKPVSRQDLLVNLKLALQKISNANFYVFRDGTHDVRIRETSIVYLQVDGNYTEIHTTDKRYVERKSMKRVLEELHINLIRIHRSYYVNPSFIKEANASVYLTTGEVLPVSRKYKKELQDRLFPKQE